MNLHMVRYGTHAESIFLSGDFRDTYDILVVNGNMAAYYPAAMARFIAERVCNKNYIIDPQTHAFQHDLRYIRSSKTEEIKSSIARLLEQYGEPFKRSIDAGRPVYPDDFKDKHILASAVERVIEFQRNVFSAQKGEWQKYYEFININPLTPWAVIAPYFFMDELSVGQWLEINAKAVEIAKTKYPNEKVVMQLVIGKGLLLSQELSGVIERVTDTPADMVAIWIDDFDETSATITELTIYKDMLRKLGGKKEVLILYGSYFSVALMKVFPELNIKGVCHGLEYAEHRPVIPVGGGLPVSKFYYPSLHIRIPYVEVVFLVRPFFDSKEDYFRYVCDCKTCAELIGRALSVEEGFTKYGETSPAVSRRNNQVVVLNYPTTEARNLCVSHYMWCKAKEYQEVEQSASQIAKKLIQAAEESKTVGNAFTAHCLRWAKVLQG